MEICCTQPLTGVLFEYLISQEREKIWKKCQSVTLPFHEFFLEIKQ